MCTQKNGNHTEAMYGRYSESFKDYLLQTVLPAVRSLEGVEMVWMIPSLPPTVILNSYGTLCS